MASGLINIFEDPSGIRDGCWLKRVRPMDVMPDDYGIAWYTPNHATAVCAPMPFHRLFGWAYRAYWDWRTTLSRRPYLDTAFEAGLKLERERAHRHMARVLEQHVKVVEAAKALAYAEGQAYGRGEVLDALRHVTDAERMN